MNFHAIRDQPLSESISRSQSRVKGMRPVDAGGDHQSERWFFVSRHLAGLTFQTTAFDMIDPGKVPIRVSASMRVALFIERS